MACALPLQKLFSGSNADPEVTQAVRACGDVLANLGADVTSIAFPEAAEALAANHSGVISAVEAYLAHQDRLGERFQEYDPVVTYRIMTGQEATALDYLRATQACEALREKVASHLTDIDVLLAPTTMVPALPLHDVDASLQAYKCGTRATRAIPASVTSSGMCSLTVPCGLSSKGLPIGLMICGKGVDEAMVLRVGHAYEQATAWHYRTPDLSWIPAA